MCGCLVRCCGVCLLIRVEFETAFMIVAEIFAWGEMPWSGQLDGDVMKMIQNREKLGRPTDCPEAVYEEIMLKCWRLDLQTRLRGDEIEQLFEDLYGSADMSQLQWPSNTSDVMKARASDGVGAENALAGLEVSSSSIKIQRVLGSGEFGDVSLAVLTMNGRTMTVAVKTLKSGSSLEAMEKFKMEAQLLSSMRHPHIVEVKAVCFGSSPSMIALEFMSGGDLQSFLKGNAESLIGSGTFGFDSLNAIEQIAEAMAYLERKKVVHRDLAARFWLFIACLGFVMMISCRNILVGDAGLSMVKLSDLGMSRTLTSSYYRKTANYRVPAKWMAPESLFDNISTHASDVWSFGVLMWEVMSLGVDPYDDMNAEQAVRAIAGGYRMARPSACSAELFVKRLSFY